MNFIKRLVNDGKPLLHLNKLQCQTKIDIETKINSGRYVFENISCVVCKEKNFKLLGSKDRYGLYFPVEICNNCGLVQTNPRMNQDSYNEFYNIEYRKLYGGKMEPDDRFFMFQKEFGRRIYKFLEGYKLIDSSSKFILEVGCGAGGILSLFQDRNHRVLGIDLGEKYVEFGKSRYGLNLKVGTLQNTHISEAPDIIIYSHVFEHILDLETELDAIIAIMGRETILYFGVPGLKNLNINYKSNIQRYFQNAHTYHFTLESLNNVMLSKGFVMIEGNQNVMAAYRYTGEQKKYISDFNEVMDYIRQTEKNLFRKNIKENSQNLLKKAGFYCLDFFRLRKLAKKLYNTNFK